MLNGSVEQYQFSKDNMEEGEVEGIQWLPLEKCDTLQWAFDHDELMNKVIAKYSHLINGENIDDLDKSDIIDKAIEAVENGKDKEYIIQLLNKLR